MAKEILRELEEDCLRLDHGDGAFTIVDVVNRRVVVWDPEAGKFGFSSPSSVMEIGEVINEDELADFLKHLTDEQFGFVLKHLSEVQIEE